MPVDVSVLGSSHVVLNFSVASLYERERIEECEVCRR
jgi:hypothetical protein